MSRAQDKIAPHNTPSFVGIDVGKFHLDLHIAPQNIKFRMLNTPSGVSKVQQHLKRYDVRLVALEATGTYHQGTHEALHKAGLDVSVIPPLRSRLFAESTGRLAKTDAVDAQTLARFAQQMQPTPTPSLSQHHKKRSALTAARRQMVKEIGDLKRRLQACDHTFVARQIRARIKMADGHKSVLEAAARKVISANADMRDKYRILYSIPSISEVTASILISELGELGHLNS